MTEQLLLEDLTVDEAVTQLREGNIITANDELRDAIQPIVDSADVHGVHNLNVIYVDREPIGADPASFAREIVGQLGGTTIVRSPGNVSSASADFSRAAIAQAENGLLATPGDYSAGLQAYVADITDYSVPWTIYSVIIGVAIVALFVGLTFYWLRKRPVK